LNNDKEDRVDEEVPKWQEVKNDRMMTRTITDLTMTSTIADTDEEVPKWQLKKSRSGN